MFCACSPDPGSASDATSDVGIDGGPDTAGSPCNPVLQDCADPNDKCTFVRINGTYAPLCVAPSDWQFVQGSGEACDRTAPGDDDCAKGFACLPNGAPGSFACFRACASDSDCAAGSECVGITNVPPTFGACEPSCALFSGDCDAGSCGGLYLDISTNYDVAVCHTNGAGIAGGACAAIWDCGPNLSCVAQKCMIDCDNAHPCPDGGACASQGLANEGGVCP